MQNYCHNNTLIFHENSIIRYIKINIKEREVIINARDGQRVDRR